MSEKRALVTGASRGIGRGIVKLLAMKGYSVVANARDAEDLKRVARLAPDRITVVVGDLAVGEERDALVPKAVEVLGGLDLLVSCAGVLRYGDVGDIEEQDIIQTLKVNLMAPLMLAQSATEHLRASQGAIINIASTLGIRPAPGMAVYSASKAGLISVTRTLAAELAPAVRVNAIALGVVDTDMPRQIRIPHGHEAPADPKRAVDKQIEELRRLHLLGRLGTPDNVAQTVLHIAEQRWMTGSIVTLDGGILAI